MIDLEEYGEEPYDQSWWPASDLQMEFAWGYDVERDRPTLWKRADGECLVYAGKMHVFMGESESCKTWAAVDVVRQALVSGKRVLWLDLEDRLETFVQRAKAVGLRLDDMRDLRYVHPYALDVERTGGVLPENESAAVRGWNSFGPAVVVVDSMSGYMAAQGADPNSATDVESVQANLRAAFPEAATVIIDHVVKSKDARGRWATGSERKISGITGAAYGFEVKEPFGRGLTGKVAISISKDRIGFVRGAGATCMTLESRSDGSVCVSLVPDNSAEESAAERDEQQARRTADNTEKIRQYVVDNPGCGQTEIRIALHVGANAVSAALKTLEELMKVRFERVASAKFYYPVE